MYHRYHRYCCASTVQRDSYRYISLKDSRCQHNTTRDNVRYTRGVRLATWTCARIRMAWRLSTRRRDRSQYLLLVWAMCLLLNPTQRKLYTVGPLLAILEGNRWWEWEWIGAQKRSADTTSVAISTADFQDAVR